MSSRVFKTIQKIDAKLAHGLGISPALQEALEVLQMPLASLSAWLHQEIAQNPLIELHEGERSDELTLSNPGYEEKELDFEKQGFEIFEELDESFERELFSEEDHKQGKESHSVEGHAEACPSLFGHLMQQAHESFFSPEELVCAEEIIGSLDERGFYQEISPSHLHDLVLEKIQNFDPPGVAARDLRDSLLIQLRLRSKEKSLAYTLISTYFPLFLQRNWSLIEKKLGCTSETLQHLIREEIAALDLRPAYRFRQENAIYLVPDVTLKKEEEGWQIEISDKTLPHFHLSSHYATQVLSEEEKIFLKHHLKRGKWLQQMVNERKKTLHKITLALLKSQYNFFNGPKQELLPLAMKEIAQELSLHESTVARALNDKYLACPQGIYPFHFFFPSALSTCEGGEVSSSSVKELLRAQIAAEDKSAPLSDEALAQKIQATGITCARRTIAKYRSALKIPAASQRRLK